MDKALMHLLDMALAVMLLVLGVTVFFVSMVPIMTYTGEDILPEDMRVTQGASSVVRDRTCSDIYILLNDGSQVSFVEGGPGISIYIDDVYYKGITDFNERRQLEQSISGMAYSGFDREVVVDEQGTITAIKFRGR